MTDRTVWDEHFIYGIFFSSTIKSITNSRDEVGTLNGIYIIWNISDNGTTSI